MRSWILSPVPSKPHLVIQTCNPSTQENRGRRIKDPWLSWEFEASLTYMRPHLKETKLKANNNNNKKKPCFIYFTPSSTHSSWPEKKLNSQTKLLTSQCHTASESTEIKSHFWSHDWRLYKHQTFRNEGTVWECSFVHTCMYYTLQQYTGTMLCFPHQPNVMAESSFCVCAL